MDEWNSSVICNFQIRIECGMDWYLDMELEYIVDRGGGKCEESYMTILSITWRNSRGVFFLGV